MAFAKSYLLIRELNRPRHPAVLWGLGAALYGCVLLATFRPALAAEARRQVMQQHIKDAMRFAHWAVSRGWPGIALFDDPTFQFGVDMDAPTRRQLLAFVQQRAARRPGGDAMLDVLDVLARDGHAALWARRPEEFARVLQAFAAQADRILARLTEEVADARRPSPRDTNRFSISDARIAFADFHRLMLGGPRWYAVSGTFLGIVREGGWLPHDYDIDVGVHAEEVDFGALHRLYEGSADFSIGTIYRQDVIGRRDGQPWIEALPVMLKLVHRTGINIDVFIHHLSGNDRWHGSSMHRWGNQKFELAPYELDGLPVLGPEDFETYLGENYGSNWRVPVTMFNGTTDTPNLEVAPNLMAIAIMLRKIALMGGSTSARGGAVLRLMEQQGVVIHADGWRFAPDFVTGR